MKKFSFPFNISIFDPAKREGYTRIIKIKYSPKLVSEVAKIIQAEKGQYDVKPRMNEILNEVLNQLDTEKSDVKSLGFILATLVKLTPKEFATFVSDPVYLKSGVDEKLSFLVNLVFNNPDFEGFLGEKFGNLSEAEKIDYICDALFWAYIFQYGGEIK